MPDAHTHTHTHIGGFCSETLTLCMVSPLMVNYIDIFDLYSLDLYVLFEFLRNSAPPSGNKGNYLAIH